MKKLTKEPNFGPSNLDEFSFYISVHMSLENAYVLTGRYDVCADLWEPYNWKCRSCSIIYIHHPLV
jgi:hypothetical protein